MAALSVAEVLPGATLGLTSGLNDLLVLDIGGRQVLYALGRVDGILHEIEIGTDGSLTPVSSLPLSGEFLVGSEPLLGAFETAGGVRHLALAGVAEANGQSVILSSTGAIGAQVPLSGLGSLIAPLGLASSTIAGGRAGGGLDLFTDAGSGFAWVSGLDDRADRYLADVSSSVSFQTGTFEVIVTSSALERGINLASVSAGTLTQMGAIGATDGLPINTPSDLGVLQRLDETLIVVSASGSSSLSVVDVGADGDMSIADHILDGEVTYFQLAGTIGTATYGDFAFVAVGGGEGGISLFTILPGGRLVHLDSFADDASTTLHRPSSIELLVKGSMLHLFVSSFWEPGLTRLSYDLAGLGAVLIADAMGGGQAGTVGADQIIGSDLSEVLIGGEGNDTISDGVGEDTLWGDAGADLFVLAADEQLDTLQDFERDVDQLDLSSWDFLYDVSQLTWSSTSDGAVISFGDEVIRIHTSDGLPLNEGDLSNADILYVDRPPLLAIDRHLVGGVGDDTLAGGAGADTIQGAAGNDALTGQGGDDIILGGAGLDTLDGGAGADTLHGQSEADTLVGGHGDDLIEGGGGGDLIYGDDYDWAGA